MKNCPEIVQSHCINKGKLCDICFKFSKFIDKGKTKENKEKENAH